MPEYSGQLRPTCVILWMARRLWFFHQGRAPDLVASATYPQGWEP